MASTLMIQHGPRSTATAAEARQLFNSLASFTPIVRFGTSAATAGVCIGMPNVSWSAGPRRTHSARAPAEGRTVQRPSSVSPPPTPFPGRPRPEQYVCPGPSSLMCGTSSRVRLVSLATQKFITDVASDALQVLAGLRCKTSVHCSQVRVLCHYLRSSYQPLSCEVI